MDRIHFAKGNTHEIKRNNLMMSRTYFLTYSPPLNTFHIPRMPDVSKGMLRRPARRILDLLPNFSYWNCEELKCLETTTPLRRGIDERKRCIEANGDVNWNLNSASGETENDAIQAVEANGRALLHANGSESKGNEINFFMNVCFFVE